MLTPVEPHGPIWVKRDDLFEVAGVRGGKVRTCWALAQGAAGLVTAGSRSSPQANIVAHIAQHLGIPARVHTPTGELSPELIDAQACGAEIIQHKAGYNSVIVARAHADAVERGWREIPFGMQCPEARDITAKQVANIPADTTRIVVSVGSGMTLTGIVAGIRERWPEHEGPKILGVCVGADPERRFRHFMLMGWESWVSIVDFKGDYHKPYTVEGPQAAWLSNITLDPHYETKAASFLQPGDLFWVVGIRRTSL